MRRCTHASVCSESRNWVLASIRSAMTLRVASRVRMSWSRHFRSRPFSSNWSRFRGEGLALEINLYVSKWTRENYINWIS